MMVTPSSPSGSGSANSSSSNNTMSSGHPPHLDDHSQEDEEEEEEAVSPLQLRRRARSWTSWRGKWNRAYLLTCAAGLIVDPLFFYTLSVSGPMMCLFIDGWFALTVTLLRCMIDAMHLWNTFLQLRARWHHPRGDDEDDRRRPTPLAGYITSNKGFLLDVFVVLPVMQVVLWVAAPALIQRGLVTTVMTVFLIMFLFQYLPKIYHSVCALRRMQNFSGYIFGTIWWGIALNLVAYFVASHAVGACWYLLGIQRATKCLKVQCMKSDGCGLNNIACINPIYYGTTTTITNRNRLAWAENLHTRTTCLARSDKFEYGAYKWTVSLVTNTSRLEKILLPIFWGLMTLSTFGNLESTTEWLEIIFNIIIITGGLILVTMLIGNIKVFLHATTSKKQSMHLRLRSVEWWMKRKHLPQSFRQRVRQYERQRWAATRGVDECEMIRNLPEGLRRDIKYHLCLDLVRQYNAAYIEHPVPLARHETTGNLDGWDSHPSSQSCKADTNTSYAVRRKAVGIWDYKDCGKVKAGGAYTLNTASVVTVRSTIRRLR